VTVGIAATLSVVGVLAVAVFIALAPWVVGFVLAVAAAGAWCSWLEHHPDRDVPPFE
jgi:hypothetical protein